MKSVNQWFADYGESHQNPINKLIHWICIPLIMMTTIGLFWAIPVDRLPFMPEATKFQGVQLLNIGSLFMIFALLFYVRLSIPLAIGMFFVASSMTLVVFKIDQLYGHSVLALSMLGVFAACWVVQLIGHNIEGKKPSFFKDLQFLLIGPLWLLGFIYRKLGLSY